MAAPPSSVGRPDRLRVGLSAAGVSHADTPAAGAGGGQQPPRASRSPSHKRRWHKLSGGGGGVMQDRARTMAAGWPSRAPEYWTAIARLFVCVWGGGGERYGE